MPCEVTVTLGKQKFRRDQLKESLKTGQEWNLVVYLDGREKVTITLHLDAEEVPH